MSCCLCVPHLMSASFLLECPPDSVSAPPSPPLQGSASCLSLSSSSPSSHCSSPASPICLLPPPAGACWASTGSALAVLGSPASSQVHRSRALPSLVAGKGVASACHGYSLGISLLSASRADCLAGGQGTCQYPNRKSRSAPKHILLKASVKAL